MPTNYKPIVVNKSIRAEKLKEKIVWPMGN